MPEFTPISALIGGALIGLSASIVLLAHGKVTGISGLYGGLFRRGVSDRSFRFSFITGLLLAGWIVRVVFPERFDSSWNPSLGLALGAGLVVGFGTQLGSGCTSGHGVCGVSRLSVRSLVATCSFIASGMATVFVARHVLNLLP